MTSRNILIALALAGAGLGAAQAATATTPEKPPSTATAAGTRPAAAARHAAAARPAAPTKPAAKARHVAQAQHGAQARYRTHEMAGSTAMDRVHERVAFAREAEQRRWIAAEEHRGKLDRAQAATLRDAAAELAREQTALVRRGHETTDEALAISHRQDRLDWAIRSGDVAFTPPSRPVAG